VRLQPVRPTHTKPTSQSVVGSGKARSKKPCDSGNDRLQRSERIRTAALYQPTPAEPARACLLRSYTASLHGHGKGAETRKWRTATASLPLPPVCSASRRTLSALRPSDRACDGTERRDGAQGRRAGTYRRDGSEHQVREMRPGAPGRGRSKEACSGRPPTWAKLCLLGPLGHFWVRGPLSRRR
jgi:hypothetical protein